MPRAPWPWSFSELRRNVGGTVDLTYSEIMCRGPLDLRELRPASGGPWGSTYVDEQFKALMNELLGGRLESMGPTVLLDLLESWEKVKVREGRSLLRAVGVLLAAASSRWRTQVANHEENYFMIRLPETAILRAGINFESAVDKYNRDNGLVGDGALKFRAKAWRLTLTRAVIERLHMPIIEPIVRHLREELNRTNAERKYTHILVVGGFSRSKLLFNKITELGLELGIPVMRPARPAVAVVVREPLCVSSVALGDALCASVAPYELGCRTSSRTARCRIRWAWQYQCHLRPATRRLNGLSWKAPCIASACGHARA